MQKTRIARSIIIKVGGGIMEIPRPESDSSPVTGTGISEVPESTVSGRPGEQDDNFLP